APFRLDRTKLRQGHLRRDVFENEPHGHPDAHFLPRALNDVADHRYLIIGAVESDMSYDVRHVILKSRNRDIVHDHEGIDSPGFCQFLPVEFPRITMRTEGLGRPTKLSTILATLCRELMRSASVPERLGIDIRYG